MVRVNKNLIPQKELLSLFHRFDNIFTKLNQVETATLLNELLGKEERLTVAKRLAAIVLIHEGCSEYQTSRLLKLSHSTTGIIADRLRSGSYDGVIRILSRKKTDYMALLSAIDSILHLGGFLPHRIGRDRYRNL